MPIAHNAVVQRLRDAVVELEPALRRTQRCLQDVDLAVAHRLPRLQQVPRHTLGARRRRQRAEPVVVALRQRGQPWLEGSISNLSLIFQPNEQTL